MKERVFKFGPRERLVGVLTEPDDRSHGRRRPAVLLSNVGVSHRVGPFRLNVELARRLASMGFYAFRFDFSGLGDSETTGEGEGDKERAVAEARAAMDVLKKRCGIDRFVMVGLCSGADKTHIVSLAEERITGAVFIDGYAHTTLRFHFIRLFHRLLQWKRLKVALRERLQRVTNKLKGIKPPEAYRAVIPSPDRKKTERELLAMMQRGVHQLHLFTISTDYVYNYEGQFWDLYPGLPRDGIVSTERYPQADHTLSIRSMQLLFVDRICRWMERF